MTIDNISNKNCMLLLTTFRAKARYFFDQLTPTLRSGLLNIQIKMGFSPDIKSYSIYTSKKIMFLEVILHCP